MTKNTHPIDRDAVLLAFHSAYAKPTASEVAEWIGKYPQFADDIIAHAAVSYDWAASESAPAEEPSESALDASFSRALSILYEAERHGAQ